MQQDLRAILSSDLVEMLIKNTEYYMDLCKADGDINKRKLAQQRIDLIIAEMKSREEYSEVLKENDLGTMLPE